jgi:aldehyde dehydrogenase (NAD+)
VVLKPSEVAPGAAYALAHVLAEAGMPPDVFNLVAGRGFTVGEALVQHKRVDMASFTGSLAGRRIGALATATAKKVTLELGGKSAAVVLADADLGAAVKATVADSFLNSGQTCSALTCLLVPRRMLSDATHLAVGLAAGYVPGDPFAPGTRLGPVVSDRQRQRVRGYIERAVAAGATLACGGAEPVGAKNVIHRL